MNAIIAPHDPLALPLPAPGGDGRRRRVGRRTLDERELGRFNDLLARLAPQAGPVSADQLVTLARWLQSLPRERAVAVLSERLARAEQLRRMLHDQDWSLDADTRERARLLIAYLHRVDDLIPDDEPLVGHLDDALLVELAWPSFDGASTDYGDFCRFRHLERPRGTAAEQRLAWENACLAEAALIQQRRLVRASHYAAPPPLPERFRVG